MLARSLLGYLDQTKWQVQSSQLLFASHSLVCGCVCSRELTLASRGTELRLAIVIAVQLCFFPVMILGITLQYFPRANTQLFDSCLVAI